MKRSVSLLTVLLLLLTLLACGKTTIPQEPPAGTGAGLTLRIVDGAGTGSLTLAGEAGGEVYTANAAELTVTANGKPVEAAALENGMLLSFSPDLTVLESWPGQIIGASAEITEDKDDRGNLAGLYLTVLEDLWNNDPALNEDIRYISVYLDDAPGDLTEGEKAAVRRIFSGRHGAEALSLSFEGLKENGYVTESELYWADGVLLSIKRTDKTGDGAKDFTFDAEKWRSGTGAIFYNACKAKRGAGLSWTYTPGSFAVA